MVHAKKLTRLMTQSVMRVLYDTALLLFAKNKSTSSAFFRNLVKNLQVHEIQWSLNSECIQSSDDLQCSETANSLYGFNLH